MDKKHQTSVHSDESGTTIVGTGELDLYDEEFGVALKEASLSADNVVVDLRGAVYIDTAIIAFLAGSGNRMLARGKRLRVLLKEGTHPLRTLKLAGLSAIMDFVVEDKDSAEDETE